jgi:hypothetical protein
MILSTACSYLPDADEVVVDFRSTLDDGITPTVADTATFVLSCATENLIGSESFHKLATISTDASYVALENKNYIMRFRHPQRKMNLWVDVSAIFAGVPFTAHVAVGESLSPQISMDLPDNAIYEFDPFEVPQTGGPTELPNANQRVLSMEIQDYVQDFDFTTHQPIEDYSPPLTYTGGGNRLLLNNQNNQYNLQPVNGPYWDLLSGGQNATAETTFAFLEPAGTNLLPNPFFLTTPLTPPANGPTPIGWVADVATTVCTQTVSFDYTTSSDAKLWTLRFRQVNGFSAFNQVTMSVQTPIPVTVGQQYTFSTYAKISLLNQAVLTGLILGLQWYDGATLLSESDQSIPTASLNNLTLVSLTATAPATATAVIPIIKMGSVEAGDDVQLSLFGAQLEKGFLTTTRMNGPRLQDQLVVPDYNAANQKIRFQIIPGFNSASGTNFQFMSGPINAVFQSSGNFLAEVPGQGTVITPVAFSAGDMVDLTIEHQNGKSISVYRNGQLLAQTPLPNFTSTLAPLNILGVGVELLNLSVFTRE